MEVARESLRTVRAVALGFGAGGVWRCGWGRVELACDASVAAAASVGGLALARPLRTTSTWSTAGSSAVRFGATLAPALLPSDPAGITLGADRVGRTEGCEGAASLLREACMGRASEPIAAASSLLASDRRAPTSMVPLAADAINARAGGLMM